jgi:ATP-binding cassette, subfamily B, bacterial
MNYTLIKSAQPGQKGMPVSAFKRLIPLTFGETRNIIVALIAILMNSGSTLLAPIIIGKTVDTCIQTGNYKGLLGYSALLLAVYIVGLFASYTQVRTMGGVGRRVLFNLRNALFTKLQDLPVAFFNQNKVGDLISRINNDTDKLNQFFSQALMQFFGNIFMIIGAGIFLLSLNIRLGAAALIPAIVVLIVTQFVSAWVKRQNLKSLQSLGGLSAEIQESIDNFKVIVAFNRLDYFRQKFNEVNQRNYKASIGAGVANNIFMPIYGLATNFAQIIVLCFGIILITRGQLSVGLLIGFLLYVNSFYNPLRQLAAVWSSLQLAMAGLDRISEVLALESDMPIVPAEQSDSKSMLEFKNVNFHYPDGQDVLSNVNFALERGKTYALVGPTGGGKTTTASLMARLYDPSGGTVLLDGKDIRAYDPAERADRIGFILQEPFLFTGTARDNILYGNERYRDFSSEQLAYVLDKTGLSSLLAHFKQGLDTPVTTSGDAVSLGQKQLIAFMRAALRNPEILILDEATANIDTVTEQLLQQILEKLPPDLTRVVIAHRLNTIENADEIFFVNTGEFVRSGSMENAMDMLLHGKRET